MTITIRNTTKIVTVDGVKARIWEGKTSSGIDVHCFVTRIAAVDAKDISEFESELEECATPSAIVEAIPGRLIL